MNKAVALVIKITSDSRAAAADLDRQSQKVSKLGKAGQIAGRLLAAGILVGAAALVSFANAAAQDQQAQVQLANTIKNTTGATDAQVASVESWITAQGKALGVTDDELRPAFAKLVAVTKDVGKAQELAALAMDVSAGSGKSLESVSAALAKAQTGSLGGLAKLGVATKDAAGKTLSLEQVTKNLAKTYDGAAATAADTAAGKFGIAKVQFAELGEEIGYKLIPFLTDLAEKGLQVVNWITENQTAAAVLVGSLVGLLAIVKLVSAATAIWSAITTIASAATKAFAAAQWLMNAALAANPVVLIVIAVIALVAALILAYKKSETFRAIVNTAFAAIAKAVGVAVEFIKNNWQKMLVILTGPVGAAVLLIIKHRDTIKEAFLAVITWVREKWGDIKDLLSGPIEAAKTAIGTAIDAVLGKVQSVITTVQNLYDKLVALKNAATGGGGGTRTPDQSGSSRQVGVTARGFGGGQQVVINLTVNGNVLTELDLIQTIKAGLAADLRRLARGGLTA